MGLSFAARELIKGIWCEADDQGLFEWKPLTLKARIMPADNIDIGGLLAELVEGSFVRQFDVAGKSYGAIRNFRKWQRPKKPVVQHPLPEELRGFVSIDDEDDPAANLRAELCSEQDSQCFYCRTEITHYSKRHNSLDVDHRVPVARGGTDERSNLVAACRSCNRGKGDMSEGDWRAILRRRVSEQCESHAKAELAPQMEDVGGRKEEKEETRASRSPVGYAFEGTIVRLNQRDFDAWKTSFFSYPDLRAELETIDARLVEQNHEGPWFSKVSGWLKRGHERNLATRALETDDDPDAEAALWRALLREFVETRAKTGRGYWPSNRGVPPGRSGCQVPLELLSEFGLSTAEIVAA